MLVVGSGNVGLIVSYQLAQAGAAGRGVIEMLPKVRRLPGARREDTQDAAYRS